MEQAKKFYEELFNQYLKDVMEYDSDGLTEASLEEYVEIVLEITAHAAEKKEVIQDIVDNILSMMERYGVRIDLDKKIKAANARLDFDKALADVNKGYELASILSYGISDDDLTELAKLHKAGKHREKIFELLEDCNFHQKGCDFEDERYDSYIKEEAVCESH